VAYGCFAATSAVFVLALAMPSLAIAQPPNVCLVLSPKLSLDSRSTGNVMEEIRTIWTRLGVVIRAVEQADESCGRIIVVKADAEARPEDIADANALGWVPFVAGRARQLVFLQPGRARSLIDALNPATRHDGLTNLLLAKLIGRTLAHEVGHILLNSMSHEKSGLMRAQFRATDVLRWPASSYTLNSSERARLITRLSASERRAEK
jgi:hypothetical protein